MAKSLRKSWFRVMLAYPWPANAVFSIAVFSLLWWMVPAMLGKYPILKGITIASRILSWILALPFAIVALLGALVQINRLINPSFSSTGSSWRGKELKESFSFSAKTGPEYEAVRPTVWSLDLLQTIEWKRFEELCAEIYKLRGFRAEMPPIGGGDGFDIRLYRERSARPEAFVLCRSRSPVGVRQIREFIEVLVQNKIRRGIFITINGYTMEADDFARQYPITLITGESMIADISHMPEEARKKLLLFATRGDYVSPTCPACGVKMMRRTGKQGMFWGCTNSPQCTHTEEI